MEMKLINEMFGKARNAKRNLNNMLYAKQTLNLKGYAIWDFVSQPESYLFEGISNEDFKEIQRKAYDKLLKTTLWFAEYVGA